MSINNVNSALIGKTEIPNTATESAEEALNKKTELAANLFDAIKGIFTGGIKGGLVENTVSGAVKSAEDIYIFGGAKDAVGKLKSKYAITSEIKDTAGSIFSDEIKEAVSGAATGAITSDIFNNLEDAAVCDL